jgi:hypothetical protein
MVTMAAVVLAAAVAGRASAQQSKDQQSCIKTINKDAAKVGKAQGKENAKCVKNGTKDAVAVNCPTADLKMKVQKKIDKANADDMAFCMADVPGFAYTSAANATSAYRQGELDLLMDVFGTTNLDMPVSSDKVIGGCQFKVMKDLEKVAAAAAKSFNKCKGDALKSSTVGVGDVQACVGDDTKGKVVAARDKLAADITKKCSTVTVATTFPGECTGASLGTLADCLSARAKCRMCLAQNDADMLSANCDLIDNGVADASCP